MKRSVIVTVVLLGTCAGASFADYYDPPEGWSDNPYFTHQQWEFTTGANPSDPEPAYINPNGLPSATVSGDAIWIYDPSAYVPTHRRGMWVVGGFDDPTSASLTLDIPNAEAMPEKLVWLQITYFLVEASGAAYETDLFAPGGAVVTEIAGSEVAYEVPGETDWYYYEKMWRIEPQPSYETITAVIDLPAMAVFAIDEAAVDTICIPEPGTVSVLCLAMVAILRKRRRQG